MSTLFTVARDDGAAVGKFEAQLAGHAGEGKEADHAESIVARTVRRVGVDDIQRDLVRSLLEVLESRPFQSRCRDNVLIRPEMKLRPRWLLRGTNIFRYAPPSTLCLGHDLPLVAWLGCTGCQ